MHISERTYEKAKIIYYFANLYLVHRDFVLAKQISKFETMDIQKAEFMSEFINKLFPNAESTASEFIQTEDERTDNVIDTYVSLKETLTLTRKMIGASEKNKIYKAVKQFYRKKYFCLQMDTYFCSVACAFYAYILEIISEEEFSLYSHRIDLFTSRRIPIDKKEMVRISNKILEFYNKHKLA